VFDPPWAGPRFRTTARSVALAVGQDLSIGYLEHDARRVRLYVKEKLHVPRALAAGCGSAFLRKCHLKRKGGLPNQQNR
jgi:hypothetical protein